LKEKEEQQSSTQTELDDLLMVFGDLEEKVEKYKVCPACTLCDQLSVNSRFRYASKNWAKLYLMVRRTRTTRTMMMTKPRKKMEWARVECRKALSRHLRRIRVF
jgi:UDP-2,3-diacylglucosamine pyrophosphatase LpxH